MKVIPQYKVIGPYNYARIKHNIEKIIENAHTNRKMHLGKNKICVIR